ncbi:MAG: hypothetical protein NTY19_05175 [Planctomycetota bacterium]|nr:hypothetical protein [Planctomycetota bacterium]
MTHALHRRAFLRVAGVSMAGGALVAGVWQPIPSADSNGALSPPKFRFAQWHDTHVQSPLCDRDNPQRQSMGDDMMYRRISLTEELFAKTVTHIKP